MLNLPQVQALSTPTLLQTDAIDSGPTALSIVFHHYGKALPLHEICRACTTEHGSVSTQKMIETATAYGFQAKVIRCSVQTFIENTYFLPAIVLLNTLHFVVVEAVCEGEVFLNDPQCGHRTLSLAEFKAVFAQLALLLTPSRQFEHTQTAPAQIVQDSLHQALSSGVKGTVSAPIGKFSQFCEDYGRILQKTPAIVVRATCEADIVHSFKISRAQKIPIRIRGAGHSCYGQSLTDDGILLVNVADHTEFQLEEDDLVTVTTRGRWRYLEESLNRQQRSFPVLTDNLNTAIGGTLSVGGYGPASIRLGPQVAQVKRLRLIKPDGEAVWCSRNENPQLFRFSLAGLGQVGFIEKVTLKTVPLQRGDGWWQHQLATFQDLADVCALLEPEENRPDSFMAYYLKGRGLFACYKFTENPPSAALNTYLQQVGASQSESPVNLGSAYRQTDSTHVFAPAVDYLLPIDGLTPFLALLDSQLQQKQLSDYIPGALILGIASTPENQFPFEAASFGTALLKILVGFYPIVPQGDEVGLAKVKEMMKVMLAECVKRGGRPYLYGWHEMDASLKSQLYGDAYQELHQLRQQLDPDNLYNPHTL